MKYRKRNLDKPISPVLPKIDVPPLFEPIDEDELSLEECTTSDDTPPDTEPRT